MLEPINNRDIPGWFLNDFNLAEQIIAELDRLGYTEYVAGEYRPRTTTLEGLGWFAPYKGKR